MEKKDFEVLLVNYATHVHGSFMLHNVIGTNIDFVVMYFHDHFTINYGC